MSDYVINPITSTLDAVKSTTELNAALDTRYLQLSGGTMTGAINSLSVIPTVDSASDLGSSSKYFATAYTDKIYLNSTATLDGSVAGAISIVGKLSTLSNGNLSLVPNGTGYTIIGDAGTTSHSFNTNDDLLVSGRLEVDGLSYFDNSIIISGWWPVGNIINYANQQYGSATFKFYSGLSSLGDNAGVNFGAVIMDSSLTQSNFVIDAIDYEGNYKANLLAININTKQVNLYGELSLVGTSAKITTASNANLSLVPNGTGYTIIGDAGTTSHTFNTNDDLLVSGRLEVNGLAYFDNRLLVEFAGTDTTAMSIDARSSSVNNSPAFIVILPTTGAQKAFQLKNGTDTFAWASFEYSIGGASKAGLAIGPGGGSARDVNLYRDSANVLKTDDAFVATGNISTSGVFNVDGVQVVSNRVVDARIDDAINSGDATTDGVIDAIVDCLIAHGLIAAA